VKFADQKVVDGTMKRQRLIIPKMDLLKQWILSGGSQDEDEDNEDGRPVSESTTESGRRQSRTVDPLKSRTADPGRLPPANRWEKFGNGFRSISHVLGSDQSGFGFRVAIASFSAAILAFLHDTQSFFFAHRISWVVIVIVIGMTPTSGRSFFGLIGRIVGTSASTGLAFAAWYIVVGNTAGVIVLTYLGNCIIVSLTLTVNAACLLKGILLVIFPC
jgi:hypothetical protein